MRVWLIGWLVGRARIFQVSTPLFSAYLVCGEQKKKKDILFFTSSSLSLHPFS